ncbi:hypothetical protein [Streptomyces sp. H39-C1]|uniref:hypothetical protein n=1 Tax=Streptomyces sp. H39-C1 TaxID=3004355 RepID=UPI0022AFCF74|nr:hypothetical protein [Streptomyces sp. H39-C1]MCZ4098277.1 hypothetical protein [Streptomyces sp. H39-C1]
MDGAWITFTSSVSAATMAATVAYLVPRRLQQRKEAEDERTKADQRKAEAIETIAKIRTDGSQWMTYLQTVVTDAASGRFVELREFDSTAGELRKNNEAALALASHLGYDLFYSPFTDWMRQVHGEVRTAVAEQSRVKAQAIIRETNAFRSYFTPRAIITTRMMDEVTGGTRSTAHLFAGTVFAAQNP